MFTLMYLTKRTKLMERTTRSPFVAATPRTKALLIAVVCGPLLAFCTAIVASHGWLDTVTKSEYMELEQGMSYGEVEAIVGAPGELRHHDDAPNHTSTYVWQNLNGSTLDAVFIDGNLIAKAEIGLR